MIRARFRVPNDDPRPVEWPIKYPYWITGYACDKAQTAILVAYATDQMEIVRLWPDAEYIESESVDKPRFSDRFPKPDWFKEIHEGKL
jgi:hypothetical protein